MIRLIASDIDGTLVREGTFETDPELYDIISKLNEKGVQFVGASGRQWFSIVGFFAPVKDKIYYISDNGAYVGRQGRNLFLNPMDKEAAIRLIRDVRQYPDLEYIVSGPDVAYVDSKNREYVDWIRYGYRFQLEEVDDLTKVEDQFIKVSIYHREDVSRAAAPFIGRYGSDMQISVAGRYWLDFMAPGVNKGQGIRALQESLGISPEETMVFGDQQNDIEMFRRAYYSFAVANAAPQAKEAARFMADTNLNNGVVKILRQLL